MCFAFETLSTLLCPIPCKLGKKALIKSIKYKNIVLISHIYIDLLQKQFSTSVKYTRGFYHRNVQTISIHSIHWSTGTAQQYSFQFLVSRSSFYCHSDANEKGTKTKL